MSHDFAELVDLKKVLALMEAFFDLTALPSAILGVDGSLLHTDDGRIIGVGWKKICLEFHRRHPVTSSWCTDSDVNLSRAVVPGEISVYRCRNGLVDAAVPVTIDGVHVVNLFTGQFLLAPPDRDFFRARAAQFGFDEDAYLAALDEIPIFAPEYVEKGLAFLQRLAAIIGEMGMQQKLLRDVNRSFRGEIQHYSGELERSRRAEAAAVDSGKESSRFIAAASHDLRQPMQALRLYLDLLVSQLEGSPSHRVAERAQQALVSAETLLNSVLDLSRLEAGRVSAEYQPVSLDSLFASLEQEFQPQVKAKGLALRLRLGPQVVWTDPVILQRIVRNLLSNALRYTTRGGILLACRERPDGRVVVEVWDTGSGIAPDHLDRLWDEFYRAGRDGEGGGLGLGLSIVRRLAQILDLPLEVASRPGIGSRFRVVLPAYSIHSPL